MTWCAASPPATTATCAAPASASSPTRAAGASRGCARSPNSTCGGRAGRASSGPVRGRCSTASSRAAPPAAAAAARGRDATRPDAAARAGRAGRRRAAPAGSNAYGLGRGATVSGGGMVLANPHFPWDGPERFYRMHLKIPGVYDVEGAALIGDPIVEIGHNATLGWSHTVSTARRFVWHRLTLVPGDPTSYLVRRPAAPDDPPHGDGAGAAPGRRHRAGHAHVLRHPLRPGRRRARHVPVDRDDRVRDHRRQRRPTTARSTAGCGWGRPRTVRQMRAVLDRYQFLPWVNVIAADATGDGALRRPLGRPAGHRRPGRRLHPGAVPAAVRGHRPGGARRVDVGLRARRRPATPPCPASSARAACRCACAPTTSRTPTTATGWPTRQQPLTGFPRIIGDEGTPRSLRTRLGLLQVQQRLAGTDGLPGRAVHRRNGSGRSCSATGCTAANSSATTSSRCARPTRPRPPPTAPTVDLTAGLRRAARLGPARRTWTAAASHVFREFALAGGIRFADPFVRHRPGEHAAAAGRRRPAGADRAGRRRAAARRHPARRTARRDPDRAARRRPDPDPRRPPRDRRLQRHQRARSRPASGYPKIAHGASFVMAVAARPRRAVRAPDPHVLAVDQPELAVLRRPDPAVLARRAGTPSSTPRRSSPPTRNVRTYVVWERS